MALRARQELSAELRSAGVTDWELFHTMATATLEAKVAGNANRCARCWHDAQQRCICAHLQSGLRTALPVKSLILMHYKEYLSAGDDAKLLLAMLPPERATLFVYGRAGDWQHLLDELAIDPTHTLILWPGDGAKTVDGFLQRLPSHSPWKSSSGAVSGGGSGGSGVSDGGAVDGASGAALPMLRVLVLDGVYGHARSMFRQLHKRVPPAHVPIHVALHPRTLSVYHRALHGYAQASAVSVGESAQPEALRICTVEAYALLLEELGEPNTTTRALVAAMCVNNDALTGAASVRPVGGLQMSTRSGASKRHRRRQRAQQEDGEPVQLQRQFDSRDASRTVSPRSKVRRLLQQISS